jgi:nucleoside-diphosphate-sugar epimerase
MEKPDRGACAVTGASGYVGSRFARALEAEGWVVHRFGRRSGEVAYQLGSDPRPETFREHNITALVHCAYDFGARGWEEIHAINVDGTDKLFEAARAGGVSRVVYISSTAAFEGCRSEYGRAKLETEKLAARFGAFVVRPGLVCGDEPGGMVGTLVRILRRSPVVPLIGSGRTMIFTVHEDDLSALVVRLLGGACDETIVPRSTAITAASDHGIPFRDLLRKIAAQESRRVALLPVPWPLVWSTVKALEVLGVRAGLRSDSVISFIHANADIDFAPTKLTGVSFRPFATASGREKVTSG